MLQDVRRPLPPCTALCAGCCKRVLQARIFSQGGVARFWDEREVNLPSMDVGEKSLTHKKIPDTRLHFSSLQRKRCWVTTVLEVSELNEEYWSAAYV